jgi:DNA-binding NarL/FixJ family response regulator
MDLTPQLAQLRRNHAHLNDLLGSATLVLCHGNPTLITALVGSLDGQKRILGAATTEREGLALVQNLRPDYLLCGDRLAQGRGIELVRTVKQRQQAVRALLLVGGSHAQAPTRLAIEAGCDAILREEELARSTGCDALQAVSVGGIYIDRGLYGGGDQRAGSPDAIPCLSERERQVLALVASGERNSAIALQLFLSIETVKTHLRHGMDKLQARDRTHAAVLAMQFGLIDSPPAVRHR